MKFYLKHYILFRKMLNSFFTRMFNAIKFQKITKYTTIALDIDKVVKIHQDISRNLYFEYIMML